MDTGSTPPARAPAATRPTGRGVFANAGARTDVLLVLAVTAPPAAFCEGRGGGARRNAGDGEVV